MFANSRKIVLSLGITALAVSPMPNALSQTVTENPPVGTYLWFPRPLGPTSDAECRDLAAQLKPSVKQAEQWLLGELPDINLASGPYYIVISKSRMETTFSAEGDYDTGNLSLEETRNGLTSFTLSPDEHPGKTIEGTILAHPDREIVTVTLKAVPTDDSDKDRVVYYCRFRDDSGTET